MGQLAGERPAPLRPITPLKPAREPVGPVDNVLRTLQLLADRRTIKVSEVANHLGVARSTAHRLLSTLAGYGAIVQDPGTPVFRAGPMLARLGLDTLRKHDLVELVSPYLDRLCEEIGETTHLIVLSGRDAVFVASAESRSQVLRVTARVGVSYPAHANSGGKALLSELDDGAIRQLLGPAPLMRPTSRTIGDIEVLLQDLHDVRKRGFATSWGEGEDGVVAVAVTQRTLAGVPVAALAVSAPEHRLPPARLSSVVAALTRATAEIAPLLA
jgi:IclR family transcriptional regulator, acetate operon repressor